MLVYLTAISVFVYVYTSDVLSKSNVCIVYSDGGANGSAREHGLRPCISLKSDIKVTGGDGEGEETAYELGI